MSDFSCEAVARAALGEPPRREGAELLYRCPRRERHANGDAHPSLKVNPKKNTWACFVCDAGGTAWALAAFFAGLEPGDKQAVSGWLRERGLLNGKRPRSSHGKRRPVAVYEYPDAQGKPVARKLRFEPGREGRKKEFAWQRWENGAWVDGLACIKTPLYRLPEVIASEDVVVVEGEKDADTARERLDLCATTGGSAADRWLDEYSAALADKDVVIIPDADEPGRRKARIIAQALSGKARSICLLEMPNAKDLTEWVERGGTLDRLVGLVRNALEWKPEVADGAQLLDRVAAYIRRFVALSDLQARVAAVWVVHTHAVDGSDSTPYLAITSAEKQSGKSRLLEVLELVVANPWFTGKVTAAVLTRKIDADQPTLLLDETDTAFGGEQEYAETLRGVLNTGHRRGGTASCCVGQGANITFKDFSTFCPKAIAGIGKLPDTVADRAIPIRLKRAARGEKVERFRRRVVESEAARLKAQLEAWCVGIISTLRDARPQLPEELTDRQQDGAEPLLAIADLAGGEWPQATRRALIQLCSEAQAADSSIGVQLLNDIRLVFESKDVGRLPSAELATALGEIETSPWGEWSQGKPLTPGKLARLLKPFEVSPDCIRVGDKTPRGYTVDQFREAFRRYLRAENSSSPSYAAPRSATVQQTAAVPRVSSGLASDSEEFSKCNKESDVAVKKYEKPNKTAVGCTVALSRPSTGTGEGGTEDVSSDGGEVAV